MDADRYSDLHPDNNAAYLVASIYIPFAVFAVGNFVSTVAEYYMQKSERKRRAEILNRKYAFEELLAMDENNDGSVDIMEFTIYLLKLW
ncbi:hypothetical protein NGA_0381300 [Nannochloropsis gaditana CCMP526]|uniref:uncharacterized protein n=1 Tax=Nannochloropsis gaditana (strain CCMP526) TaxID=1093141 RepID=UPI00029F5D35|nr:hypothetical protein NGA_0381300 [Nannochloropsis gaditana CCMP526]EKU21405.1 hypothetical protein NGA_0381300 [Nannochloropsis gaditana CCMP526]|eukprot:XP_005854953.1 hypothetical protein NGA_0381300 [Nannochloropsis gaditana CCMP526]